MTDPLTEIVETIERRHARKLIESTETTPTPEELAEWREWATALHPPGSIQDFMLRLLDALEAATNRWQGMARQWHEQEIAGLTYRAETAERERDAWAAFGEAARRWLWPKGPDEYDQRSVDLVALYRAAQPAAPATDCNHLHWNGHCNVDCPACQCAPATEAAP